MTAARKKIPSTPETFVLTESRRRCCLCAHVDGDWSARLGQIAHLDQDPSNNALDNLAFLCFEHHSNYDSKTSQHKNFTEAEVKHWRDELYRALAKLPVPSLSTPAPIPGAGRADVLRARDLETVKTVLRSIHWPTLDNHIQELPLLIFDPILHFWEGFNGVISSSLFHIYDSSLASAIRELHIQWGITVSFGIHYMPRGNGSYIFANPNHRPLTHEEERDWERIQKATVALAAVKRRLLDHIRRTFEEVDIQKLSDDAWSEYSAFQSRFPEPRIAARNAEKKKPLGRKRNTQIAFVPSEDTSTRRTAELLNILIASPSDVVEERLAVERVILDWNASHLESMGVMLHPVRWESHAYPASGNRPQGIINKQIVESGDVLIGIFGYKLGTSTGRARSGTIEEIEEFRKAGKHVALYFSSADVPRSADRSQLEELEAYKKERQRDTLYFEFEDVSSLRDHLTRQLPKIVENVRRKLKPSHASAPETSEAAILPKSHGSEIELLDVKGSAIHLDESEIWRMGKIPDCDAHAFLLPFYLDPRRSAPGTRIEYAMAHLVFVGETSARTRIAHGCWINAPLDCTEIRPGETKYLILAIGRRDSSEPFVALSTNRTSVHWDGDAFEDFELPPGKYKVEITLIWGGNSEFRKLLELPMTIP